MISRICSGAAVFVTATSVTSAGSRLASPAAAAIRSCTSLSFSASGDRLAMILLDTGYLILDTCYLLLGANPFRAARPSIKYRVTSILPRVAVYNLATDVVQQAPATNGLAARPRAPLEGRPRDAWHHPPGRAVHAGAQAAARVLRHAVQVDLHAADLDAH